MKVEVGQGRGQPRARTGVDGGHREDSQYLLGDQGPRRALVHGQLIVLDLLLWALRRRRRFVVRGESMQPTLHPGDWVLVDPSAYRTLPPVPGDVVVSKHPFRTHVVMVKRVANVTGKAVHLKGDNSDASTDSASLGAVPMNKLVGKVVLWRRVIWGEFFRVLVL